MTPVGAAAAELAKLEAVEAEMRALEHERVELIATAQRRGASWGAISSGRSPLIVLREAERSLSLARQQGPNSVRIAGETASIEPVAPSLRRFTAQGD